MPFCVYHIKLHHAMSQSVTYKGFSKRVPCSVRNAEAGSLRSRSAATVEVIRYADTCFMELQVLQTFFAKLYPSL